MEYNDIKEQFKTIIKYSQFIPDPQIDDLFERWYEAKKGIIDKLGGLIYEKPEVLHIPLSEEVKTKRLSDFLSYIYEEYGNQNLINFITANQSTFYDNIVENDFTITHSQKKIKKGMKLVKAFKYFEEYKPSLDDLQSRASQIIQENKVEGKLCISVHPLDFLSMSCNTYNWRSCHALNGEYRAGNLSYMVDSSTIICYLKGADNVEIPFFPPEVPWNSKKWRMLLYLSDQDDFIFAGKQYPYNIDEGMPEIIETILNTLHYSRCDWDNQWRSPIFHEIQDKKTEYTYFCYEPHVWMRGRVYRVSERVQDISSSPLHFNDVLRSTCYEPHYIGYRNHNWSSEPYTGVAKVGGSINCLCCGEQELHNGGSMMCLECDFKYGVEENEYFAFCDCCGERHYREDCWWLSNDDVVCDYCYHNECFTCPECGEVMCNSNKYCIEEDSYVCYCCYVDKYNGEEKEE